MTYQTIQEWGCLKFKRGSSGENGLIPQNIAKNLFATAENLRINKQVSGGVLTLFHNRIQARGAVGIIQSKDYTLEILPKIEPGCDGEKDSNTRIRKKLVKMIALSHNLKVDVGSQTALESQSTSLLEILIGMFADKLVEAVRQGLPQKYILHEEDLSTLKGSLNNKRQFTIHAANPARLACRFDQFSFDIPLNQIMKATVDFLSSKSKNSRNQQLLRELLLVFADVSSLPAGQLRWDQISINRSNNRWHELYSMAQMFLKRQFQTTTKGSSEGYALLFDMNRLFEEYIGRLIRKAAKRLQSDSLLNLEVYLQRGGKNCIIDEKTDLHKFRTLPDILVMSSDNDVVHIIDTKWKHIRQKGSDIWNTVNQSDVYQMMAYGDLYNSPRITLFYPHSRELAGMEGKQLSGRIQGNAGRCLEVFTFDLSNEERVLDRLQSLLIDTPLPV